MNTLQKQIGISSKVSVISFAAEKAKKEKEETKKKEEKELDPLKNPRTKAYKERKEILNALKKVTFLLIAIILMAFAQAMLNYTSRIGMAPVDALTKSFGTLVGPISFLNPDPYTSWNYIVVALLVIGAIVVSKPGYRLLTSTAFITGFGLAFLVGPLTQYVVSHFPGLEYHKVVAGTVTDAAEPHFTNVWLGIVWFIIAYFLMTLSIGIWINVGFGLRPYDVLLVRLNERFTKLSYTRWQNICDSSFTIFALIFTGISCGVHGDNFWSILTIGPGSILLVFTTGYIATFWRNVFKNIV